MAQVNPRSVHSEVVCWMARSVMDLRSAALSNRDLAAALQASATGWAAGAAAAVDVQVSGEFENLPEDMEHNLLRIAQEAVANASKRAQATRIEVRLERIGNIVNLTVSDDGRGFRTDHSFETGGGTSV
jgi:signal transduction histidine kinase